jgi:hypothetical protein
MQNYATIDLDQDIGNQISQVATILIYAKKHNKTPVFFSADTDFILNNNDKYQIFPPEDKPKYNFKQVEIIKTDPDNTLYVEGNVELLGFTQSFKYFEKFREEIQRLVFGTEDIMYKSYDLYRNIKKTMCSENDCDYVTIHVEKSNMIGLPYYNKAYEMVSNLINSQGKYGKKNMVIISDDCDWCEESFKIENSGNTYFVKETDERILLILTTLFSNNILSRSPTSWWGSYLSNGTDKSVTFPSDFDINVHYPSWIIV